MRTLPSNSAPTGSDTGQTALIDRVRAELASHSTTREVSMFGGRSFMVNEKILVAARTAGALLVRVDPARNAELATLPGTAQAEMGTGRSMGPSWISVAPEVLASDEQLSFWLGVALDYNSSA